MLTENDVQKDIATALNNQYPEWSAFKATSRDGVEYVEFTKEDDSEMFIITITKRQG